ncbi:DnaJ family domain-containing protein [Cellulomonas sp. NPDC055163]
MQDRDPHRRAVQYRLDRLDRLAEQDRRDDADAVHDGGAGEPTASPSAGDGPAADGRAAGGRAAGGSADRRPAAGRPRGPRPPSMAARGSFADELVRQAMARGEFDDLPLTGKPIPGLTGRHDPDWWLKALIEREQITGVLPEALQLRKDDAALDGRLDQERTEERVRELVEELGARVVAARRQLLGGPPVVTPVRDVETEVARWHERRRVRRAEAAQREREESAAAAAEDRAAAEHRAAARSRSWLRVLGRLGGRSRAHDRSSSTGAPGDGPASDGSTGDGSTGNGSTRGGATGNGSKGGGATRAAVTDGGGP